MADSGAAAPGHRRGSSTPLPRRMSLSSTKPLTSRAQEYVQRLLTDRGDVGLFVGFVDIVVGSKKPTERLLVVSQWRVTTVNIGVLRSSIKTDDHYYALRSLVALPGGDALQMIFEGSEYQIASEAAANIAFFVRRAVQRVTAGFPPECVPQLQLGAAAANGEDLQDEDVTPGEALETVYRAQCNWFGTREQLSVTAALVELAAAPAPREVDLAELLESVPDRELSSSSKAAAVVQPIAAALRFSTLFTKLSADNVPLGDEGAAYFMALLRSNTHVRELSLTGCGASRGAMGVLTESVFACAPGVALERLDLSHSALGRDGSRHLGSALSALPAGGLRQLFLRGCGLAKAELLPIMAGLHAEGAATRLEELDLSGNRLGAQGSRRLAEWLSQTGSPLRQLLLVDAKADIAQVFSALEANAALLTRSLQLVDVSRNKLFHAAAVIVGRVVQATRALESLILVDVRATKRSVLELLHAVCRNAAEPGAWRGLSLDMSGNDLSGGKARKVFAPLVSEFPGRDPGLRGLILNDCSLGADGVAALCEALETLCPRRLELLSLDRNLKSSKLFDKTGEAATALAALIPRLHLKELHLQGSDKYPMRLHVVTVVNALVDNSTVEVLDVTGNKAGDDLADALAAVVRANSTLQGVAWDDNRTSLQAFWAFAEALADNHALVGMLEPQIDAAPIRASAEEVLGRIREVIARNAEAAKASGAATRPTSLSLSVRGADADGITASLLPDHLRESRVRSVRLGAAGGLAAAVMDDAEDDAEDEAHSDDSDGSGGEEEDEAEVTRSPAALRTARKSVALELNERLLAGLAGGGGAGGAPPPPPARGHVRNTSAPPPIPTPVQAAPAPAPAPAADLGVTVRSEFKKSTMPRRRRPTRKPTAFSAAPVVAIATPSQREPAEAKVDEAAEAAAAAAAAAQLPRAVQESIPEEGDARLIPVKVSLFREIERFQIEDYAREYFKRRKHGIIFRRLESIESMVEHQTHAITHPLMVSGSALGKRAVALFKLVMDYMGDGWRGRGKAGREDKRVEVCQTALDEPELRDELFCQLIKQTTKNPHADGERHGFELLATCVIAFRPSGGLLNYLRNHLGKSHRREDAAGALSLFGLQQLSAEDEPDGEVVSRDELDRIGRQHLCKSVFGATVVQTLRLEAFVSSGVLSWDAEPRGVPSIVKWLIGAVWRLGAATTEGVFRLAGDVTAVRALKLQIQDGDYSVVIQAAREGNGPLSEVLVAADLLKIWLRELVEPVVPFALYDAAVAAGQDSDHAAAALAVVQRLPDSNRAVVNYLCSFLRQLATHEPATRMGAKNLALVLAPNLLRCPSGDPQVFAANARFEIQFVTHLVEQAVPQVASEGGASV